MTGVQLAQVCRQGVAVIPATASVREAAELLCRSSSDALVVTGPLVDRPTVLGIVTDRDIVQAQLENEGSFAGLRVADVISPDLLLLTGNESVENAIGRLRAHGVCRAPIVSAGGVLAGLANLDELLRHVADRLSALALVLSQLPAAAARKVG